MYRRVPVPCRLLVGLTALLRALLPLVTARAQKLSDGLDALNRKYEPLRRRGDLGDLLQEKQRFDPDKHKEAVAVLAKYPIYQLYLRHFDREPGKIAGLYSEFEKNMKTLL